ncbi:uncharacterized protein BDW43DRAFT_284570 [Aspergillus alliaceus]|uniref:uncharacterized protein n=1 Tax=Petromyces alliaceus TaxID=209559 RepID=UPI0012A45BE2|nr:uncharacterized protein BDW43DRAFT_284570 [Aspergillus alliaceus]KAB8230702.1 hypothetical protein BDW43DRAFT_284570 [Aspergillus alliaceus]
MVACVYITLNPRGPFVGRDIGEYHRVPIALSVTPHFHSHAPHMRAANVCFARDHETKASFLFPIFSLCLGIYPWARTWASNFVGQDMSSS